MTREVTNLQRGFSSVLLLAIAAVLVLGGVVLYMSKDSDKMDKSMGENNETMEESKDSMESMTQEEMASMGDVEEAMMQDKEMSDDDAMMDEEEKMDKDKEMTGEMKEDSMMEKDDSSQEPVSISTPDPVVVPETTVAGSFEAYTENKLALAAEGDVVLFFHAPWCPTCRALEANVNSSLSEIPDGVHLLKVDYDSETDLKKKYGVVRQHTLVQVDENGNKIKTLTGLTNTLAQVVAQIE